ncbi:MAG: Saccharopine dehydrogenase [Phylliscum demangeonii]|nr:MAG: Saccharopine dehydrogenase [Phylliscum demangeonii]
MTPATTSTPPTATPTPPTTIHLRSESKPLERRSALTPATTRALVEAGYQVHVERSTWRIFDDDEFADAGAELVAEGSWTSASPDTIILGLKELPDHDHCPLMHTHVQFAHCYKRQAGWQAVLGRFVRGRGTLLDLEFLTDDGGRRVAAFGYHAGFAGAALALMAWAWQIEHDEDDDEPPAAMPGVQSYDREELLVAEVAARVEAAVAVLGRREKEEKGGTQRQPRVLVMGALGRCGRGAVDFCARIGLPPAHVLQWDMAETRARPGPYPEIMQSDVFINCIYLTSPIPPFIDRPSLRAAAAAAAATASSTDPDPLRLRVVCDVSCDTTNVHNPLPIYSVNTTFDRPTVPVRDLVPAGDGSAAGPGPWPALSVISIDHLPSLLPREASLAFSDALLPSLLLLRERQTAPVWTRAASLFAQQVALWKREQEL